MLKFSSILHPIDLSESPQYSLNVARSLARDHQAKLVLLTVVNPPPAGVLPTQDMLMASDTLSAQYLRHAVDRLKAIANGITDVPVEYFGMIGVEGDVIINVAKERNIDLIVMGTHGRTGLSHFFMGSVAEYVMNRASCPVLTIRPGTNEHFNKTIESELVASGR